MAAEMQAAVLHLQGQQQLVQQQLGLALQQINGLRDEVTVTTTRAEKAEQERSDLIRIGLKGGWRLLGLVDTKGVGQPFKLTGKVDKEGKYDQDFSEWSLKMTTYVKAKFGSEMERMLKWSVRQKKIIVEVTSDQRHMTTSSEKWRTRTSRLPESSAWWTASTRT